MNVHELLQTMSDAFASTASVRNVYGDPVTVGARTVIPMAQVRYGFGGGGGKKNGSEGGGGGGGMIAKPTGVLEITPEVTRFIPFEDKRKLITALATGFALGALIVKLTRPKNIEVVKRSG
jgi:uncharacterized spore protein YtfJ